MITKENLVIDFIPSTVFLKLKGTHKIPMMI